MKSSERRMSDAITIDLRDGQHILFVKVGAEFNLREDLNTNQTFIYDDMKFIASIQTNQIEAVHYI